MSPTLWFQLGRRINERDKLQSLGLGKASSKSEREQAVGLWSTQTTGSTPEVLTITAKQVLSSGTARFLPAWAYHPHAQPSAYNRQAANQ